MRKTSQDGGDTTSITSGVENEIKKTGAIIKTKKNSIKRKVQSLSHESDDAVIEPLLQKDKEKTETQNQSAKYNLLTKTKTDSKNEKESDKEKLLEEDKTQDLLLNDTGNDSGVDTPIHSPNAMPKYITSEAPLHNHMNTNVFNSPGAFNCFVTAKSQVLVEIDTSKQSGLNPSPLIFTTAKIHTNDKAKHMEPLQVTPVPIISTIEVSIKGTNKNKAETSFRPSVTSNSSTSTCNTSQSNKNIPEKVQTFKTFMPEQPSKMVDIKDFSDKNNVTQSKKTVVTDPLGVKDFKIDTKLPLSSLKDVAPQPVQTPVTVNLSAANYTTKQISNDKTEKNTVLVATEPETDLNKNRKAVQQPNNLGPSSQITNQESIASNVITGNKFLQRQKNAIDGNDTASQLASTIANTPHGIVPSVTKSLTQFGSHSNDLKTSKNINDLPKSNANDIHITSAGNNQLSGNTVLPTTANKLATSNSVPHVNPIVKTSSIFITNPIPPISKVTEVTTTLIPHTSVITKTSTNNVISSVGEGNPADSITCSKLPTNAAINKPTTSVASSVRTINVSLADVPSLSNKQIVTTANPPITMSVTPSISKTPAVSTSTTKSLPTSTVSAKAPASTTKNQIVTSNSTKVSKANTTTMSTTTANKPTLTSTINSPGVSKISSVPTTTGTEPKTSITTGGISHVSTKNNASITVPVTSSTITKTANSASRDSSSTQSQKRSQELTNGNKKLNA